MKKQRRNCIMIRLGLLLTLTVLLCGCGRGQPQPAQPLPQTEIATLADIRIDMTAAASAAETEDVSRTTDEAAPQTMAEEPSEVPPVTTETVSPDRPGHVPTADDVPETAPAYEPETAPAYEPETGAPPLSEAAEEPTSEPAHPAVKRVLCFGDSNTYGYDPAGGGRYPEEQRWTVILGALLGDGYEVTEEGMNGRTTAYDRPGAPQKNGLTALPAVWQEAGAVDELILMLGTNDCLAEMNLSEQEIAAGLEKLLIYVRDHAVSVQGYQPRVTVVVPPPVAEGWENGSAAYELDAESVRKSRAIAPLYGALAEKYGCRFLDTTAEDGTLLDMNPLDCEHLSPAGHRTLAELLYKQLKS